MQDSFAVFLKKELEQSMCSNCHRFWLGKMVGNVPVDFCNSCRCHAYKCGMIADENGFGYCEEHYWNFTHSD